MPEIEKIYTCVVCSKRFDSKRALGGHMRWHDSGSYTRTSFSVEKTTWTDFMAMCDKHGTTACAVLRGLIQVTVAGEKQGVVAIPSQNPINIQLVDVRLGAPRGRYSHVDLGRALHQLESEDFAGKELTDVVSCDKLSHHDDVSGRIGFCRSRQRWVTPEICLSCVRARC